MTTATRERTALIVDLWKEGRSVAGIIMEVENAFGRKLKPESILRQVRRYHRKDPKFPRAQGAGDVLDARAAW